MKLSFHLRKRESGNVLFVTLIATAIIGAGLAGYLRMVSNDSYSVARSQAWNEAIPVLEAGIEEALAQLSRGTSASSMTGNGWTLAGTNYVKNNRDMGGGSKFNVRISTTHPPVIESEGFVPLPLQTNVFVARRVRVGTTGISTFMKAMATKGQIDLNGKSITTDSFDSSDPAHSTGGRYDASKRKDNGDVATNAGLVDSPGLGTAGIRGRLSTGPGGSVSIGPAGAVGDAAWHAAGNIGVQPGWSTDDMNVSFPEVVSPYTVGLPPASGNVGGTNYNYVLNGTDYSMSTLNLSGGSTNRILVMGNARLYVSGDISITDHAGIVIAPGATLKLYAAGASTALGGSGIINESGGATNFSYYGLPSNTSIDLPGNSLFAGTIYAPHADITLGHGGSTNEFVGAFVSKSVTVNGHINLHYDELLGRANSDGGYVVTAWNEY